MDEDPQRTQIIPRLPQGGPTADLLDDRFEIFEDVGIGPIAKVHRAWDHRLQHVVAIKVLDSRFAAVDEVADLFARAGREAGELPTHPNVVSVFGVGRHADKPHIVRQIVTGANMADLTDRQGPLTPDRALRLLRGAAGALGFAHQYGKAHGDVKPQNLLVARDDVVFVTDWGMRRVFDIWNELYGRGRHADDPFRAPELAPGSSPTAAADVYALGAVLWTVLTGAPPADPARDVRDERPDLPAEVATILRRALYTDAGNRYRNAGAFAAALDTYLLSAKGDTPRRLSVPQQFSPPLQEAVIESSPPVMKSDTRTPEAVRARGAARPLDPRRGRSFGFGSLLFLLAVAIAGAGGWYAYKAIAKAVNGSSTTTVGTKQKPPSKNVAVHGTAVPKKVVAAHVVGCPGHTTGPVTLVDIWAETVAATAGKPIFFDYTIANDAPQCHEVALHLTALPSNGVGSAITDAGFVKIIGARPGTHKYRRRFTFPNASGGTRWDIVWTVTDPSGTTQYGSHRVAALVGVAS